MNASTPIYQDVVLVGGGHSHALLIRKWAMQPLPGVRLTLISEHHMTPYSGMLPGLLAGHYSHEEVHIDLTRLCHWAGVRFIEARMHALDLSAKAIHLLDRPSIEFDLLSLDTGSTPNLSIPGAAEFSTPVKPVSALFNRWQKLLEHVSHKAMNIAVVGSGAGGFEIVMALRHTLPEQATLHWVLRGQRCLKGRPEKVGDYAMQAAQEQGVKVHQNFDVTKVAVDSLHSASGARLSVDEVLWCTAAAAPAWVEAAGFEAARDGFIATNEHLQSLSHPYVFATGDIGTQLKTPSDKAGVFAVRQAPVLFENIRRSLLNQALKNYSPQKTFLSLMAVGRKSAIANRGALTLRGDYLWRLKDHIDQTFMKQFRELPAMSAKIQPFKVSEAVSGKSSSQDDMRCKGCGSKLGEAVLHQVLNQLQPHQRDDIDSGLSQLGDAAVFASGKTRWVQSIDQISAIVDDPYVFGQIAAAHALSDVATQTLDLHSAQAVLTLPPAADDINRRDLSQMLAGALVVLNQESCSLLGGHSAEAAETLLGFVVNGKLDDQSAVSSGEALQKGDVVILTKPLGTGVIMAAHGLHQASGAEVGGAVVHMQQSNRAAADVFRQHHCRSVTDVTGFGLLAHLRSLLSGDEVGVLLNFDAVPLQAGAIALAKNGIKSSLYESNSQVLQLYDGSEHWPDWVTTILCDPQTSGGLLGVVPATAAQQILIDMQQQGYSSAAIIGEVADSSDGLRLRVSAD